MNLDGDTLNRIRSMLLAWPELRRIQVSDREDLVQDVLRCLLESDRPRRSLSDEQLVGYAIGILRHRKALLFRRHLLEHRIGMEHRLAQAEPASFSPAPIEVLAEKERTAIIIHAISRLPEPDRCILNLRTQGLTFEKIAAVLGKEPPTIRKRYIRALKRIRDAYFGRA